MRTLLNALGLLALGYALLCLAVFVFQGALIYFPQPRIAAAGTTTLTLAADVGPVLVTSRPRAGAQAVLYFGGNAEDVSMSLPELASAFGDAALYLMHYRGYGGSAGTPAEAGLVADAVQLFDQVRAEHPRVTVIGRSLGSGIAVQLAAARPVARLVLVTPYFSLVDIGAAQFPFLPVRWLMRDKFESWRHAPRVTAHTTFVVAEHDEVIPRRSSDALYQRFGAGVATIRVLDGTSHNTVSAHPGYTAALNAQR